MQLHIPGRPRLTGWGPQKMNRGSVGCSFESACGVGLANCQDAQIMCECTNVVNYICGEVEARNTRIQNSNNKGRIFSRDLRWNKNHLTNRRNKNRIRRSLLRRIHAVKLKEGLSEAKRKQKLENSRKRSHFIQRDRRGASSRRVDNS